MSRSYLHPPPKGMQLLRAYYMIYVGAKRTVPVKQLPPLRCIFHERPERKANVPPVESYCSSGGTNTFHPMERSCKPSASHHAPTKSPHKQRYKSQRRQNKKPSFTPKARQLYSFSPPYTLIISIISQRRYKATNSLLTPCYSPPLHRPC